LPLLSSSSPGVVGHMTSSHVTSLLYPLPGRAARRKTGDTLRHDEGDL